LPKVPVDGVRPDVELVLTKRIGFAKSGRVDVYYASLQGNDGLVVRIQDLAFYPPRPRKVFAERLCTEFDAYNTLDALQGTVVPRMAGMFAHGLLYCMVFEDAGRPLTTREQYTKSVG